MWLCSLIHYWSLQDAYLVILLQIFVTSILTSLTAFEKTISFTIFTVQQAKYGYKRLIVASDTALFEEV